MRNYSLDFLKGFMSLGILFIHTGTFIITTGNFEPIDSYMYAMTSLFVPTFFIVSGYFFAKSRNQERALNGIVITYLLYMGLILIFNTILLDASYDYLIISDILYTGGMNYFWFVNSLMYYMFIYFALSRLARLELDKLFWLITMILAFNFIYFINTDQNILTSLMELIYFSSGFLIAKIKVIDNIKVSKYFLLILLIYPLCVDMLYNRSSIYTLLFSLLLFTIFKSIDLKKNFVCFYSKYSLLILFVHYYVVQALVRIDIVSVLGDYYIINFLILLIITLAFVHFLDIISRGCGIIIDKLSNMRESLGDES